LRGREEGREEKRREEKRREEKRREEKERERERMYITNKRVVFVMVAMLTLIEAVFFFQNALLCNSSNELRLTKAQVAALVEERSRKEEGLNGGELGDNDDTDNSIADERWPYRRISGKTLVVIYGLIRTFDWTVDSIVRNIILPNQPCDVVLSIDQPIDELGPIASEVLKPYLTMTFARDDLDFNNFEKGLTAINTHLKNFYASNNINGTQQQPAPYPKEFYQMERVLRWAERTKRQYDYVIKIRTDNYAKWPIQVSSLYGDHPDFAQLFEKHGQGVQRELNLTEPLNMQSRLWAWFITGGIAKFARGMLVGRPSSAYSRLGPLQWNQGLKNRIDVMNDPPPSSSSVSLQSTVRQLSEEFRLVYLIGSTWIHFGKYEHIRNFSINSAKWWGSLLWEDFGFEASAQWRYVTESHMRLTHLKNQFSLVDLRNLPDYRISFNRTDTSHFQDNTNDDTHFYWIVRGCDRHKEKANCK